MEEIWKETHRRKGYEISNLGRVRHNGRVLKPFYNSKRYRVIRLGRKACCTVHRLVAECFIPNPESLPQINHKDENKQNNVVSNLEWCTQEYNVNYGTGKQRRVAAQRTFYKDGSKYDRPISQFKDGELVATFRSARDAARVTGCHHAYAVANGTRKSDKGYTFRWVTKTVQ